jgi:hypothetical protein
MNGLSGLKRTYGLKTILTLILVYFGQGFRYFGSMPMLLYFKDTMNFTPADLSMIESLIVVAWYLKPIFGLISDTFPIFGYRRKSYIMFSGFLGFFSYLPIFLVSSPSLAICLLALGQFSQTIADVVCDGFMVERSRVDPLNGAQDLQKISWSTLFFTAFIGQILGGFAAENIDPKYLISSLAACPLLVISAAFIIPESQGKEKKSFKESCSDISGTLKKIWTELIKEKALRVVLFTFLWNSIYLSYSSIMNYYLLDVAGVTSSTLGIAGALANFFSFVGMILPDKLFNFTAKGKFFYGTLLLTLVSVPDLMIVTKFNEYLGVSVTVLLFGSTTFSSVIYTAFYQLPTLVIFAHVTPKDVEATFFSFLSAVFNISMNLGLVFSGIVMNVTGINSSTSPDIWMLIVLADVIGLASMLCIFILPDSVSNPRKELEHQHDIEIPLIRNELP